MLTCTVDHSNAGGHLASLDFALTRARAPQLKISQQLRRDSAKVEAAQGDRACSTTTYSRLIDHRLVYVDHVATSVRQQPGECLAEVQEFDDHD